MQNNVFCVDIGGTKTAFALFKEGKEVLYGRIPTRAEEGAEALVRRILSESGGAEGACRGVIASPGPLDARHGVITSVATMGWRDVPIVMLFSEAFGIPFSLLNDCDAGALGAWNEGGERSLCYISVSTGVGGGIVAEGKLITGRGNAADFGHMPVPGEGLTCGCGRKDCLELYASGSGIERRYERAAGKRRSCAEIARLAEEGDSTALRLFADAGDKLGFALRGIRAVLDPDVVVLGGGVCAAKELFFPRAAAAVPGMKFRFAREDGKQVLYGALAYAGTSEQ